jgi:hypothetical protein
MLVFWIDQKKSEISFNHNYFFIANLTLNLPFSNEVVAFRCALKFPVNFDYNASLKYSPKYMSETPYKSSLWRGI